MQETIVCATAGAGPGAISVHDIQTTSTLASFKQSTAGLHCTAVVESRNGQGGFVLAAQSDKSILNVYSFQKVLFFTACSISRSYKTIHQDQITLKIVLPEKLTCLATDPLGNFCAGGTAQGRVYLWEVR
jgi:pre-rRNA-processing protein IPI3